MTYEELQEKIMGHVLDALINNVPGDFTEEHYGIAADAASELTKLFATLCAEVMESGRVDGMFIEWNGLNLADIKEQYACLAQLTTKNTEEENV